MEVDIDMSKQSEAKKQQGYRSRPDTCSSCRHYRSTQSLYVAFGGTYTLEKCLRCGIGGFAITKSGVCNEHALR